METANIAAFVQTLDPVPVLSQCFHSYSQLQLWPYGYDYDAYPDNYEEIQQLAIDSCDAIYSVHGTVFDPINSADLCKLDSCIFTFYCNSEKYTDLRPRLRCG